MSVVDNVAAVSVHAGPVGARGVVRRRVEGAGVVVEGSRGVVGLG